MWRQIIQFTKNVELETTKNTNNKKKKKIIISMSVNFLTIDHTLFLKNHQVHL